MKKIRIIDVAERAGVSKSTISQYLNGRYSHMSQPTKAKIKAAIEELNYVPNPIARSLKTDSTKTIGVVVRDITGFNISRVLRGIDDYCKGAQYNVLIYNTDFDTEVERNALLNLKQMRVDGIIITSSGRNTDLINEYQQTGIPIVQFQLEYPDCKTSIVLSDYRSAAFEATEYLIALGHRRIGFMSQDFSENKSRFERYQGYVDALEKHGIPVQDDLIFYWCRETGFGISPAKILASPSRPTALFTQHLALTHDLLKSLNHSGLMIPKDVSLVGFDEIPMVELFKVPVTVMKQDPYKIGEESAKLILKTIKRKCNKIEKVIVPCVLVERESCAGLK